MLRRRSSGILVALLTSAAFVVMRAPVASAATVRIVPSSAFPTIQSAVTASANGDVVKVKPSHIYHESVQITQSNLTLEGIVRHRRRPMIDAFGLNGPAIFTTGANTRIRNFVIRNVTGNLTGTDAVDCASSGCGVSGLVFQGTIDGICIEVVGDGAVLSGNTIRHCGDSDPAIVITGDNARILRNRIALTAQGCIAVRGNAPDVERNHLTECEDMPAIDINGQTGPSLNPVVRNNFVQGTDKEGIIVAGENPVVTGNTVAPASESNSFDISCGDAPGGAPGAQACSSGLISRNRAEGESQDNDNFDISAPGLNASPGLRITRNISTGAMNTGFNFQGDGMIISRNRSSFSGAEGEDGIDISGDNNVVSGNVSNANGGSGILVSGADNTLDGNTANANNVAGIIVSPSNGNTLHGNTAKNNNAEGIVNHGTATILTDNVAAGNRPPDCANNGTIATNTGNHCASGGAFTNPPVIA
jgi:parallel beta-helix repeat protein